ncbi:uncharacterized protein TNCV_3017631 [Trichonephila clavipes]|nr:uncharacterized protein TNCV_3017631 [Trichonephila clavipes]
MATQKDLVGHVRPMSRRLRIAEIKESYTEILSGQSAEFLEDEVSLRDLSRMWYQQNGAHKHKSAQPCTSLAQTFDSRIIGYGGEEVAEATGGVSDAGLVLHFCGRQSF